MNISQKKRRKIINYIRKLLLESTSDKEFDKESQKFLYKELYRPVIRRLVRKHSRNGWTYKRKNQRAEEWKLIKKDFIKWHRGTKSTFISMVNEAAKEALRWAGD